ncbi:MAG: M28 family peptidase [Bryobacterales bacterium]|nr:M28 family peptidase [Bryobacterales bacterium]
MKILFCAFLLTSGAVARAETAAPSLEAILRNVRAAYNSGQAMDYMRHVYANDRYFTFPRFQATAEYLKAEMQKAGLRNAEILGAPADGVTQAGFWTMPLAWDVKSARLEILDSSLPEASRVLADYEKVPSSLGMWSGPTAPGGVTAEIVEVKKGDIGRLGQMDLHGKLALTEMNPANIKWLLVKAGALGAINTFTENPSLADGRQWVNAWGDDGWAFTKRSTPLLCFSITPRQASLVRKLLARGPVRVKAVVDARYYSGTYPYVTAVVPGTGPEEVLTLGHMAEQGAQDNATGVAATLEALGTLHRLIEEGKLPRPKRSIRILAMGEMYGSMHYVEHNPERIRRTVAAMCVDTPAASYDLAGTEYSFYMNPHVAKDFTDAFILEVAASHLRTVGRPWHEKPFTTGTDTYLAEPMVGIPTVWGYSGSGVETHHNSEDTPDRVDTRSLRDISVIDAAFLYYIANAGEQEAIWLARLSESRGYRRMLKAVEQSTEHLDYALDRETQAVLSVLRLAQESRREELRRSLDPMVERLRRFRDLQFARTASREEITPAPADGAKIIVKRKRFGTVPLDDLPHEQWGKYPSGAWAAIPTIALYWCDGHRNLAEVARLTQLELGRTDFDFVGHFRFLRRHNYVDFVE